MKAHRPWVGGILTIAFLFLGSVNGATAGFTRFDTSKAADVAFASLSTACNPRNLKAITGTEGDDVLIGTPGDDILLGLGGNDTIVGLGGNDILCGGPRQKRGSNPSLSS
jgi:Ca2+-binding RTX toxin-like protein